MKLAVLMSTYNGAAYLQEQIESILAQEGDFSLTLLVRDDGSSDETIQILHRYADIGKLQWYRGQNLNSSKSFMDLLRHSPGYDFYAFADQDDFWEPGKLQAGIARLSEATGPAFSFANAQLVDRDLQPLGRNVYREAPPLDFFTLSCAGGILGCTMVFNRELAELLQRKPIPEQLVMHDFYVALVCALAGGQIFYDGTPRMKYRQHGNNVVGVSISKLAALKDRLRTITRPSKVTVGQQASTILDHYPELGQPSQQAWLKKLADPGSFSRASIALSRKTRYASLNKSLTLRLAILLGNR